MAESAANRRSLACAKGGTALTSGAAFKLPVYLDAEVEGYLAKRAQAKGVELVNQLLKREITIVEGGE